MADELEGRHVTPQAELGELIAPGYLELRRCVCGTEYSDGRMTVRLESDPGQRMPCCGAQLIFRHELLLFEVVEPGGTITQPRDDHPVWDSEVSKAGPLTITLRHIAQSMREDGGTFAIHAYSRDGNPLVDAATADGATLDELVEQQQQEEAGQ